MTATAPSLPLRIVRWLWVPLEDAAAPLPPSSRRAARTARALLLLGEHALGLGDVGDGALDAPSARAAALVNFREALRVGLPVAVGPDVTVAALFDAHPARALAAAGDASELAACRRVVLDDPIEALAAQDDLTLEADAIRARDFARRALDEVITREASRGERLRARFTRMSVLALGLVAFGLLAPPARRAFKRDIGPTSTWRASTTMGPLPQTGRGFQPREGEGNFFFQTQIEGEPWIEFDLGAGRTIEMVTVQNRLDCCQDWAVPLVIEVGDEARRWREVGRRVEPFYFYTALFPSTAARYVRLRVPRMTSLHLGGVQIK